MILASALTLAFAVSPPPTQEAPRVGALNERRMAVLAVRPEDLPRAEAGRWAALLDPERREAALAALDPRVLPEMRVAESAYGQRLFARALESVHHVLRTEADFPPAWLIAGASYLKLRRYAEAVHSFERFLAHAPDDVWRTQGLGHALHALERYEEARDHYAKVLEHFEQSLEARRGVALAELRLGDARAAISHLDRLLAAQPNDADALAWRAHARLEAQDAEGALVDAARAEGLAPADPRPVRVRMEALVLLGRDAEAAECRARLREREAWAEERRRFETLLLQDPRQPFYARELVRLARTARDPGLLAEALEALDRSRGPGSAAVGDLLLALDAWLELAELDRARAVAARLEDAAADSAAVWQRLALFWAMVGEPGRAEEADRRARARDAGR